MPQNLEGKCSTCGQILDWEAGYKHSKTCDEMLCRGCVDAGKVTNCPRCNRQLKHTIICAKCNDELVILDCPEEKRRGPFLCSDCYDSGERPRFTRPRCLRCAKHIEFKITWGPCDIHTYCLACASTDDAKQCCQPVCPKCTSSVPGFVGPGRPRPDACTTCQASTNNLGSGMFVTFSSM
jgi:hypothetical protein